jgi:hypothetical protein
MRCHCCVSVSLSSGQQFCKLGVVHWAAGHEELAAHGAAGCLSLLSSQRSERRLEMKHLQREICRAY